MVRLSDISERTFRPNPAYRYEPLDGVQDTSVREMASRPGVAGILRGAAGELKIVGDEVAALYRSLLRPSCLSRPLLEAISHRTDQRVVLAALVLDEILEVESDGEFVSGAASHGIVFGERASPEPQDPVARLSIEALKYGQALRFEDTFLLAARLYCFNRWPASVSWKSRLPSRQAVAAYLGFDGGAQHPEPLHQYWARHAGGLERPEWLVWRTKKRRLDSLLGPHYKLYVSPEPKYLREALHVVIPVITAFEAHTFKTGADLYGILRPDKLVAYFYTRRHMLDAAQQILSKLSGIPPHGVPFTGNLDGTGVVSWGIDPPKHAVVFPWSGRSWRCWLTERLSAALVTASHCKAAPVTAWEFALDRLRLDGVDTDNWEPDSALWQAKEQNA